MTKKIALQIKSDIARIGIEEILKETKYEIYHFLNIEELEEQAIEFDLLLFEDAIKTDNRANKIQIIKEDKIPLRIENSLITIEIPKEELPVAVSKTLEGHVYIEERIKKNIEERKEEYKQLQNLTDRELRIIEEILEEKTNKEISNILYISEKTVKNNLTVVYKKLKVKNRIELQKKYKNLLTTNKWDDNIYESQHELRKLLTKKQ